MAKQSIYMSYGTWQLPEDEVPEIISAAIESGFTHIDTAAAYANEARVGEGIELSSAARESIFVSGKLWTSKRAYDAAIKACRKSLRNMHMEYFDQYLMHWPASAATDENWREINSETWRALEQLKKDGLVRKIGVCNCKPHHLMAIIDTAEIIPEVNQIEFHPGYMQEETVDYCKAEGIALEAWSALGHGALLLNPSLLQIAERHNVSTAQVILSWCMQKGISPITKTRSRERMESNLKAAELTLTPDDIICIDSITGEGMSGLDADTLTKLS